MINFTQIRKSSCYLAIVLVCFSVLGLASKGLNLGLDFTGGYLTQIDTPAHVSQSDLQSSMQYLGLENTSVNLDSQGQDNLKRWNIRAPDKPNYEISAELLNNLSERLNSEIILLDSVYIGANVGEALLEQGGLALLVASVKILLYLSLRFEWRLALGALLALMHDVLIVLGTFAWLQISFDLATMAAVLAIIGYSLNDSIVIGDRIRELLLFKQPSPIQQTINSAVKSTFVRTMVTSGTTLVTISAIWILAGQSLAGFSIALFIGVIVGSVSSISISATVPALLGLDNQYYLEKQKISEDV